MKIIQQQNWVFTLYEDEHGQFVLDVLFPAKKGAWASYEVRFFLSNSDKQKIQNDSSHINEIVKKLSKSI